MTDDTMTFDEKLRAWKERTGISLTEGAAFFEISKRTFQRYLSGEAVPHRWLQGMMLAEAAKHERGLELVD